MPVSEITNKLITHEEAKFIVRCERLERIFDKYFGTENFMHRWGASLNEFMTQDCIDYPRPPNAQEMIDDALRSQFYHLRVQKSWVSFNKQDRDQLIIAIAKSQIPLTREEISNAPNRYTCFYKPENWSEEEAIKKLLEKNGCDEKQSHQTGFKKV